MNTTKYNTICIKSRHHLYCLYLSSTYDLWLFRYFVKHFSSFILLYVCVLKNIYYHFASITLSVFVCVYSVVHVEYMLCCVFVLFFFVLCAICCRFLWIVHFWMPIWCSLTFIYFHMESTNKEISKGEINYKYRYISTDTKPVHKDYF